MKALKYSLLLLLFVPLIHFAAVPQWKMDPSKSTITFTATQNNAPVSGKFNRFTGDIHFDRAQLNASNVRIVIDMNSVSAAYRELTDTLLSADWFNIKIFPQATFQTVKMIQLTNNTFEAEGTLTIRDKSVPTKLTFTLEEYNPTQARVKGKALLKRTQFGIGQGEWSSTKEVKDDVLVEFTVVANKI